MQRLSYYLAGGCFSPDNGRTIKHSPRNRAMPILIDSSSMSVNLKKVSNCQLGSEPGPLPSAIGVKGDSGDNGDDGDTSDSCALEAETATDGRDARIGSYTAERN